MVALYFTLREHGISLALFWSSRYLKAACYLQRAGCQEFSDEDDDHRKITSALQLPFICLDLALLSVTATSNSEVKAPRQVRHCMFALLPGPSIHIIQGFSGVLRGET
jgi:hypothetical protein